MSPDRLIASLHREVILRKPEVFKMACLRDIARLFGADPRHAHQQPGGLELKEKGLDPEVVEKARTGAGVEDSPGAGAATATLSSEGEESKDDDANNNDSPAKTALTSSLSTPSLTSLPPRWKRRSRKRRRKITPPPSTLALVIVSLTHFRIDPSTSLLLASLRSTPTVRSNGTSRIGGIQIILHPYDRFGRSDVPAYHGKGREGTEKPEYNDFNYWRPEIVDIEYRAMTNSWVRSNKHPCQSSIEC